MFFYIWIMPWLLQRMWNNIKEAFHNWSYESLRGLISDYHLKMGQYYVKGTKWDYITARFIVIKTACPIIKLCRALSFLPGGCYLTFAPSKFFISHFDVIQWKHFPRYWPFVQGIHRWPVNSPHKGQWRGALMVSLIAWINGWVNNREAGDLRRQRAHYDVIVMLS